MQKTTDGTQSAQSMFLWVCTLSAAFCLQIGFTTIGCQPAHAQGTGLWRRPGGSLPRMAPPRRMTRQTMGSRQSMETPLRETEPEEPLALNGISRIPPTPPTVRNSLPPCMTDSFVHEAGGNAELIYGDESFQSPPPYYEFTQDHRIERGIHGIRDAGLTTGHGSWLPNAWGDDEFISAGGEWSQAGTTAAPQAAPPAFTPRNVSLDNFDFSIQLGPAQIDYNSIPNMSMGPRVSFTSMVRTRASNR